MRFYAALSVVIAHTKTNFGELRTQPATYPLLEVFFVDAQTAVTLFFVLSGFLITYLLLSEHSRSGTVSVPRFYARRMLRIWPLYYLVAAVGFVLLPVLLGPGYSLHSPPTTSVLLVLLLMPNFVGRLGPLSHLWTIGLEEQFYATWPWVLKRPERLLRVAMGIVLVKVMIAPAVAMIGVDSVTNLSLGLRFESMAIGSYGAYLYFQQHRFLSVVHSLPAKLLTILGIAYLALVDVPVSESSILLTSALSMLLVLNVSTDPKVGGLLEIGWLDKLGRMSYGIYMYHYPVLYLVVFFLAKAQFPEGSTYSAILYGVTLSGTLAVAAISYRWFEGPFLRMKDRFAVVANRPNLG